MARLKFIEDGERVSVVLSKKQIKWLRHMAITMSKQGVWIYFSIKQPWLLDPLQNMLLARDLLIKMHL